MNRFDRVTFSPSLLGGNLLDIGSSVRLARNAGADRLHIDIMDGHFAPDFGFNVKSVREICALSVLPVDVHLMTLEPDKFIQRFTQLDIGCLIVHLEALEDIERSLSRIRAAGKYAGLAISPETRAEDVKPWLPFCDEVVVMTVPPGRGGEPVDEACIQKVKTVRYMTKELHISVDGGMNLMWACRCVENGADKIVAGTAFFSAEAPASFCAAIHGMHINFG